MPEKKSPKEDNRDVFEKALDYAPEAAVVGAGALGAYLLTRGRGGRMKKVVLTPAQRRKAGVMEAKAAMSTGKAGPVSDDALTYAGRWAGLTSPKPAPASGIAEVVKRRK